MATNLFSDPEFQKLEPDQMRQIASEVEPDFAALPPDQQDQFLSEQVGYKLPSRGFMGQVERLGQELSALPSWEGEGGFPDVADRTIGAGARALGSEAARPAANVLGILSQVSPDPGVGAALGSGADYLHGLQQRLEASGPPPSENIQGQIGESLAESVVSLAAMYPAVRALGPIAGLAAFEGVKHADEGPVQAAVAAGQGAMFGIPVKLTEPFAPVIRAASNAAISYVFGGGQPETKRIAGALTMGALSGLPSGHDAVRGELDVLAARSGVSKELTITAGPSEEHLAAATGARMAEPHEIAALLTPEAGTPKTPENDGSQAGVDEPVRGGLPPAPGEPGAGEQAGGGAPDSVVPSVIDPGTRALLRESGQPEPAVEGQAREPVSAAAGPAEGEAGPLAERAGPAYVGQRDVTQVPPDAPLPKKVADPARAMERLAKALGVPVTQGTIRPVRRKGVLGWASVNLAGDTNPRIAEAQRAQATRAVRVKRWGDIQTATHEIMHVLDNQYPEFSRWYDVRFNHAKPGFDAQDPGASITPAQAGVASVSYDVNQPWEGFAEFGRHWYTNDKALQQTPELKAAKAEFEEMGPQVMGAKKWKAMLTARADMHRVFEQGGRAALRTIFAPPRGRPFEKIRNAIRGPGTDSVLQSMRDRIRNYHFDQFAPQAKLAEMTTGKGREPGGIWGRWWALKRAGDITDSMWEGGAPKWDPKEGGVVEGDGRGLNEIWGDAIDSGVKAGSTPEEANADFKAYGAGRMEDEMVKLLGPDAAHMSRGLREQARGLETPAFKKAFGELQKFHEGVLDFGEAAGLFSREQRQNFRRQLYAWALNREVDKGAGGPARAGSAGTGIYKYKGSTRRMIDPLDALLMSPGRIVQLAQENLVHLDTMALLQKPNGGMFGQIIPAESKMARVHRDVVRDELLRQMRRIEADPEATEAAKANAGITASALGQQNPGRLGQTGMDEFLHLFLGKGPPAGDNVVTALIDGKPIYAEITDQPLLDSWKTLRPASRSWIEDYWRKIRPFYQRARTMTVGFAIGQVIRDTAMAHMQTKTGMNAYASALRNYTDALRGDPVLAEMALNLGGATTHAPKTGYARNRELIRAAKRRANPALKTLDLANPAAWARYAEAIGNRIEQAHRADEYRRARAQGMKRHVAADLSRRITTDFSMGGGGAVSQFLQNTLPFFRAMTASTYQSYLNIEKGSHLTPKTRQAFATKFLTYAGAVAMYQLWARRQPWYDKRLAMYKLQFPPIELNVPGFGKGMYKPTISLAYEAGLMANLINGATQYTEDLLHGKSSVRQLAGDTLNAFSMAFGVGLPMDAQMALEQYSGKKAFYGYPLDPPGQEDVLPYAKKTENTPRILVDAGQALHDAGMPNDWMVSPPRMQAALDTALGPWAGIAMSTADWMVHSDKKAAPHLDDLLGASTIMSRVDKNSTVTEDFYNWVKASEQMRGTQKRARTEGNEATVEEFQGSRGEARAADRAKTHVSKENKRINIIMSDRALSPTQKRDQIDEIRQRQLDYMREKLAGRKTQ